MAAFYRRFGWPEAPSSVPEHVVFQCSNGVVLGLFSEPAFEARFGPTGEASRGFALTIHVEDEGTVDRAHGQVGRFDDVCDVDVQPTRSGWGYGFGFRDPEGNRWGVAVKFGSSFDPSGGFIYPCVRDPVPSPADARGRLSMRPSRSEATGGSRATLPTARA